MGKILAFKRPTLQQKAHGNTLCRSNLHKWKVVTERKFDVKQGRLVTVSRCERCGKERVRLL